MPRRIHPRDQVADSLQLTAEEIRDTKPGLGKLASELDALITKLEYYANVLHTLTEKPDPDPDQARPTRTPRVTRKGPKPCAN